MKQIKLSFAIIVALFLSLNLNAQHKLGLSYNPFVEKYRSSLNFKPVSGSINYESKEFGRFSLRSIVYCNYFRSRPDFVFSNLELIQSESNNYVLSFASPSAFGELDYISESNIGIGVDTKFRLSNSASPNKLYIFGGFNADMLYNIKWHFSNGLETDYPLSFYKYLYTKFGVGYSYKINHRINLYVEPVVNYQWSFGICHFGINTGVMFNLGK